MLVILAFTLLFAFPVDAAQSTASAADPQLKTRVEQRLDDRRVRGIKVSVVRDGTIALTGSVASAGMRTLEQSSAISIGAVPGAWIASLIADRWERKYLIALVAVLVGTFGMIYGLSFNTWVIVIFGFLVAMGGLAMGAWIAGRFTDGLERLRALRIYAALEGIIALCALAMPFAIGAMADTAACHLLDPPPSSPTAASSRPEISVFPRCRHRSRCHPNAPVDPADRPVCAVA